MNSLKSEFIKYLSEKYLGRVNDDISEKLVLINETGVLLRNEIVDLSALDNDDFEFTFRLKVRSEVLQFDGNSKLYAFVLEYSCLLDNGINNLKLNDIYEATEKRRFTFTESLTDCFIPLNKRENYEKLAIRFLKKYLRTKYSNYPLDVVELVNRVGLKVYISTNFSDSLGKTIFKECDLKLNQSEEKTHIEKGSVVINVKNYLLTGNNKLVRTTAVHECLHWHFHKKAFEIIMLLNNQYKYFDCKEYKDVYDDPILTALSWMESQAYAVTKACMMLEQNITKHIGTSFNNVNQDDCESKIDEYYSIVSDVSNTFGTTMSDTVKRLSFLGYHEVDNLKNEYYGSLIDSVIQNEKLNDNQTRRINQRIYNFMIENSPNLKMAIDSGLYVYVDGFVIIKSSKYLIKIINHYILNSYARNHIEECTLVFNIKKNYKSRFNPSNAMQFFTANNEASNATILVGDVERYVIAPFMIDGILEQKEPTKSTILKNAYIHEDGLTFSEYFKQLIKKYKFESVNELIDATHCSRTTIENYRDLDDIGYTIEKVLSICAGMKLTPPEAKHLIQKAGIIDLTSNSKRAKVYKTLVEDYWNKDIDEWNKVLIENHMPVLYSER